MVGLENSTVDVVSNGFIKNKDIKQMLNNIAYGDIIIWGDSQGHSFVLKKRKIKYFLNIKLMLKQ
ncbi:MAG: hypothetical protein KDC90_10845 [Ignavibacteriae bacterium]|nr:hypothetical protein [Ignavibacteriota bacterium]